MLATSDAAHRASINLPPTCSEATPTSDDDMMRSSTTVAEGREP